MSLTRLVFPPYCPGCGRNPALPLACCLDCLYECNPTNYHFIPTRNPAYYRLNSYTPVSMAVSGFYFHKGSIFQKLIFKLKYHRLPQVGVTLGQFYGHQLRSSPIIQDVEAIIPIPLHSQKLRKKGYNHAERIAYGIAQTVNIPLEARGLKRIKKTQTQTKLNAEERLQNVNNAFQCKTKFRKSVILVDDILTTGATLSTAIRILQEAGVREVRVITLGIAGLR